MGFCRMGDHRLRVLRARARVDGWKKSCQKGPVQKGSLVASVQARLEALCQEREAAAAEERRRAERGAGGVPLGRRRGGGGGAAGSGQRAATAGARPDVATVQCTPQTAADAICDTRLVMSCKTDEALRTIAWPHQLCAGTPLADKASLALTIDRSEMCP